jgi:hypothetical protein
LTDYCSGTSVLCVDARRQATEVCRPSLGECDPAENCTGGVSSVCPADVRAQTGTQCGGYDHCGCYSALGTCVVSQDNTKYCYNLDGNLRATVFAPAGQACGPVNCP